MNFLEAVQALKNGECRWVTRPIYKPAYIDAGLMWSDNRSDYYPDVDDILATDWELVDPKPLHEEREVVRWAVLRPDDSLRNILPTADAARQYIESTPLPQSELRVVELRGTYTVEIPRPTRKRVTGRVWWTKERGFMVPVNSADSSFDFDVVAGKTGTLTFEED